MIPSEFGGYLFDKRKAVATVAIREVTEGGHVVAEKIYDAKTDSVGVIEKPTPIKVQEPTVVEEIVAEEKPKPVEEKPEVVIPEVVEESPPLEEPKKSEERVMAETSDMIVYGEMGATFTSFRDKFLSSAQNQTSFMNSIIEKMEYRSRVLDQAEDRIQDENEKLEDFLGDKVGK